jgi:hypothetical protein
VGDEFFHADGRTNGQTDMTRLIVAYLIHYNGNVTAITKKFTREASSYIRRSFKILHYSPIIAWVMNQGEIGGWGTYTYVKKINAYRVLVGKP